MELFQSITPVGLVLSAFSSWDELLGCLQQCVTEALDLLVEVAGGTDVLTEVVDFFP